MQLRESLRDYDGIITGMPTRQLRIRPPLASRVDGAGGARARDGSIRSGAMSHGRGREADRAHAGHHIDAILERLVQLDYVSRKGAPIPGRGAAAQP